MPGMRVLLTVASFTAEHGGPPRSVSGLANALADQGCQVGTWAPDQSALTNQFLGQASAVLRFGGSFAEAIQQFGGADVVHDNGIWLPHNHQIASFCHERKIARVVSSRGMLEPWARKHKKVKKWIAWALYQRRDLHRASALHATSDQESGTLKLLDFGGPIWVVPNGIGFPKQWELEPAQPNDDRIALFIGRVYPVKGLPMLLDAWATHRPPGWRLRIVGPDEAGHTQTLKQQIASSGLNDVVTLVGPLEGEAKEAELRKAELFICPSYTENFGIAIAEAMAHGLPVITTTGTPWPVLKSTGIGWWVEPTAADIGQAVVEATGMSKQELADRGVQSSQHVRSRYAWDQIGKAMMAHYEQLQTSGH